MQAFRELKLPYKEQMRRAYFEAQPDGRLFFSPYGLDNHVFRSRYVVPAEAVDRIITIMTRGSYVATALSAATLIAVVGALLLWQDPFIQAMTNIAWLVFPGVLAIGMLPILGGGWAALRLAGPFPPAAPRTFAEYAAHRERYFSSKSMLWLGMAIVAGTVIAMLWIAVEIVQAGNVAFGLSLLVPVAIMVPALMIIPVLRRARRLHAENEKLEGVVRERTQELQELNRTLEQRVNDQVRDIERLGQLKHFFSAPVAEMILGGKGFDPAKVHRRELTAVSLDLRGFTAFSETSEPEEVITVLRLYHAELGIQVNRHQATLEHFAGDGVMLFFNDPVEVEDHPRRALELAVALRNAMRPHLVEWRSHGFDIGLGIGIATGYATIGAVGYEGRWEYAAIGTVCNLAARLCAEAKDGQVIVSKRFMARVGDAARFEALGERPLKGLARPVAMFNVVGLGAETPAVA
jgi:class 3 adenylate cyclase